MQVLTNIVIGEPDEIMAIGESLSPLEDWQGMEANSLNLEKLAMLQSILADQNFDEAFAEFRPLFTASDEGPWLIRFPHGSIKKLAELEEDALERIGEELAATTEFEIDEWAVDEVQDLLATLSQLAGNAVDQEKTLFIWMGM
ncbi:MAG TPA: hypothetical protein VMV75_05535 [Sulfuricella sp.]|nr:hypothetical protein [Sulfuricella sp.]